MTAIVVKAFNGLKPILKPRLLAESDAQVAQNARLISGSLEAMRASTILKSTTLAPPKTIFRYGNSATESNYWLEFLNDTDVMRSPIPNDQYDRLYWADGINPPRYAPNSLVLTGAPYPGASYLLGIPAPSTKPAFTSYSTVPVYTTVTRDYVITFYSPSSGKESAPGSIFSIVGVDGQKVALTDLTTDNLGDTTITKKRLYRKVSGTFRRVAEIDLATTTYDDTATDASLATAATLPAAIGSAPSAPTRAPTVSAPVATGTDAGIARQYVYTIKNITDGTNPYSESAPSTAASVTADETQTITITMNAAMFNGFSGTHFRVYRKDAGAASYQFVAEVPVSQTAVTDPIATTVLGSPLEYDSPVNNKPSTTPTLSASSSSATTLVKRIYMLTFADASGNESVKGPASSVVTVIDGQTTVTISHSETVPAGVTKKRLYRQTVTITNGVMSSSDANWKLVGEDSASTTSTTDAAADSTLTTGLAAALQSLPPSPAATPGTNATIPAKQVPESRTYVYTYVSAYGEEGAPSDASDVVALDATKPVTITMAGPPSGNYNITLKRIYRSSTVGSQAQFQFVAEIPVATTTYVDSIDQAALGEVLPTENWIPPPTDLKGLRMMASGAAVGFSGRTIYLSEPNLPHAWPHKYTIDYDIVGIATFGQTVAVMTNSFPFLLQGADPAAMTPTKIEVPQACVSKTSIVETGDGVLYSSPDGYVSIGAGIDVVTKALMSRDQWQAYTPASMKCYLYNGRVHMFYDTGSARGCLVLDPGGQGAVLTTLNISSANAVTAGYYDPHSDILYLAQSNSIVRVDQGSALTATWRSKLYRLPYQQNFAVGQVRASAYPVTLRVYADGALKHTQTVTSSDHFTLPGGFRGLDWEFEVDTTNEVSEVILASSVAELKSA